VTSTAGTELQCPQLLVTASTAPPVNASDQTTEYPAVVEDRGSESTSGPEVVSAESSAADLSHELPQDTLATSTGTLGSLTIRLRLPTATDTSAVSANAKGTSFCPIATGLTRSIIGRHGWNSPPNGGIKQKETHRNSSVGEGHGASHSKHCTVSVSPCHILAISLFPTELYVVAIGRTRTQKEQKANSTRTSRTCQPTSFRYH
jgi:hypothetical protein